MNLEGRLMRLSEILILMSGSPVPTHLFQTLGDHATGIVPGEYLAVCLTGVDNRGYRVHCLRGPSQASVTTRSLDLEEGLAGRVMRTGRVSAVMDLGAEPDSAADVEGRLAAIGLRAALAAPVRRGTEMLGALLFASRPPTVYTDDDIQIAGLMAAGLSSALETSRAYQALADERSTMAAVLGSTQDAVLAVNQEGMVVLANPAVRPMLGLDPESITGRRFLEVVGYPPLVDLFQNGRLGTTELPLPDGRIAQASLVAVETSFGEPVGLGAVLRDITLLKHLEQMKNDFVNTVSHDLKNPIAVISTTSEMLLRTSADARSRERYQRIWETSLYMNELVNDLLDLGKIEAGLDAPNERVELAAVVEDAVKTILSQAEAKRLALSVEVPAGLWVMAAPARLKQAFVNLVGNAVKYTPEGGAVEVRGAASPAAKPDDSTVLVRVTDTGIGIPAQDLSYVFDKFYRVRNKSTSGIPGTGLGLAIVKGIVEQHRGRIWVESNEGTGSTFFLELPLSG